MKKLAPFQIQLRKTIFKIFGIQAVINLNAGLMLDGSLLHENQPKFNQQFKNRKYDN